MESSCGVLSHECTFAEVHSTHIRPEQDCSAESIVQHDLLYSQDFSVSDFLCVHLKVVLGSTLAVCQTSVFQVAHCDMHRVVVNLNYDGKTSVEEWCRSGNTGLLQSLQPFGMPYVVTFTPLTTAVYTETVVERGEKLMLMSKHCHCLTLIQFVTSTRKQTNHDKTSTLITKTYFHNTLAHGQRVNLIQNKTVLSIPDWNINSNKNWNTFQLCDIYIFSSTWFDKEHDLLPLNAP